VTNERSCGFLDVTYLDLVDLVKKIISARYLEIYFTGNIQVPEIISITFDFKTERSSATKQIAKNIL
jgi:hypothetical protein